MDHLLFPSVDLQGGDIQRFESAIRRIAPTADDLGRFLHIIVFPKSWILERVGRSVCGPWFVCIGPESLVQRESAFSDIGFLWATY
jgi:hypothetical protein